VAVNMSPLCSPKYSIGRASQQSVGLAQFILDLTTTTGMLDMDSLCIVSGLSAWVIYCDIVCLDDDGNVTDAALLSVLIALKHLRLPPTKITEDGVVTLDGEAGSGERLKIRHFPVPLTFAIVQENTIADPTAEEESLMNSSFTIVYNEKGELCTVYKAGGSSLSTEQLKECMHQAQNRVKHIVSLM